MYYAYARKKNSKKKYYFTGTAFDTTPFRMKKFQSIRTLKEAVTEYAGMLPKSYLLYSEKVGGPKKIKKPKKKTVKKK